MRRPCSPRRPSAFLRPLGALGLLALLALLMPLPAHAAKPAQTVRLAAPRGPTAWSLASGAVSRATVAVTDDLCAPCDDPSQCDTGVCAVVTLDGNSYGRCTQVCEQDGACPHDMACINDSDGAELCNPFDADACPQPYVAPKNAVCRRAATTDNPNSGIARDCAAGLTCYGFPSGIGVCVTRCSTIDASAKCAAGETCCFDTASDGSCVTSGSATVSTGGCFVLGDVGSNCAQPDHSYCNGSATCAYAQVVAAAACYNPCNDGACETGGYCVAMNGVNVCCDARSLTVGDVGTCEPQQGICRRELGVACTRNDQCLLGLCQKNGTEGACSVICSDDADCPDDAADVNSDGLADGGSQCLSLNGSGRCWPKNGPIAPPACATAAPASAERRAGCQCAGGSGDAASGAAALLAWATLRRRRAKGRGRPGLGK